MQYTLRERDVDAAVWERQLHQIRLQKGGGDATFCETLRRGLDRGRDVDAEVANRPQALAEEAERGDAGAAAGVDQHGGCPVVAPPRRRCHLAIELAVPVGQEVEALAALEP